MIIEKFFIPTLNKQGFATTTLDHFSEMFASFEKGEFLEIGAAFGLTTLAALKGGASVTANDIDVRHLKHIEKEAKEKGLINLTTSLGAFPDGIKFPEGYFQKILISRVLHFFTGEEIERAIKVAYNWLRPGGKLFIVCETPFLNNWSSFLPEYEKRKKDGVKYPGEIDNPKYWEKSRTDNLPDFVHWLDKDILERIFINNGFENLDSSYINRKGQFPSDLLLDGRESVGIVGSKY